MGGDLQDFGERPEMNLLNHNEIELTEQLILTLRSLQLPLVPDREHDVLEALIEHAEYSFYSPNDLAILIANEMSIWEDSGEVGRNLNEAVRIALEHVPPVLKSINARTYFSLYKRLRSGTSDTAGLTHSAARRLLSRASLIAHLLGEERFSCSQVARLLQATESSLDVPHGAVAVLARELNMLPSLDRYTAIEVLQKDDFELAVALFPDSDVADSNVLAAAEIESWMPESNVTHLLDLLSRGRESASEPTWPYLQVLHWCLTPIEFYDHPASYLYEFSPRGQVAKEIFNKYPTVTGNPVLNNAKAVETINATWARNRGGEDAHALVALLAILESLPFIARRQIARVLRAWLWRIIELKSVEPVPVVAVTDQRLVLKFVAHVCGNETYTQGVIEQRVVDFLSYLAFQGDGWRVRGIRDGVNASNLSRKKLGDLEFTNVDQRSAIAIEAHGGFLSSTYVADHQRSLSRIVNQRLEDSWLDLDDPESWSIRVLFVAHAREVSGLPVNEVLHGVAVEYEYLDYGEFFELALGRSTKIQQLASFEEYVTDVLNLSTVRESVREKFRELITKRGSDN